MAATLLAGNVYAGEPDTAALERGYTEASSKLAEQVVSSFKDPKVCDRIFYGFRLQQMDQKTGMRKIDDGASMRLDAISTKPPTLRQDPNDLYQRYRSAVNLKFTRLDSKGNPTHSEPYEVTLLATADTQLRWSFPTVEDVIIAATEKCNDTALATAQIQLDIEQKLSEVKRLKKGR